MLKINPIKFLIFMQPKALEKETIVNIVKPHGKSCNEPYSWREERCKKQEFISVNNNHKFEY